MFALYVANVPHLSNKHLLSVYHVPDSILSVTDITEKQKSKQKFLTSWSLNSSRNGQ